MCMQLSPANVAYIARLQKIALSTNISDVMDSQSTTPAITLAAPCSSGTPCTPSATLKMFIIARASLIRSRTKRRHVIALAPPGIRRVDQPKPQPLAYPPYLMDISSTTAGPIVCVRPCCISPTHNIKRSAPPAAHIGQWFEHRQHISPCCHLCNAPAIHIKLRCRKSLWKLVRPLVMCRRTAQRGS